MVSKKVEKKVDFEAVLLVEMMEFLKAEKKVVWKVGGMVATMGQGLVAMMGAAKGEVGMGPLNLGNPYCEISLNQLVEVFREFWDKGGEEGLQVRYVDATENDPQKRRPDIRKAEKALGFRPKVGLVMGLKRTFAYFFAKEGDGQ